MTPILGNFLKIYLEEYGTSAGYGLIGCTTGDSITFNTEFLETTGLTSSFSEFQPTYKSGQISSDTTLITTVSGDPQIPSTRLIQWEKNNQKLRFACEWEDGGTPYRIEGVCYIASLSINAPAEDFVSCQLTLNISGEWQLDF